ncbi:prepilin peptidase [Enterococcus saccharolyticus]|uniref:Prepilin peptidase A24 N-terminal domain-containing protein n=1 Tax=Candidatus Enterococcus willemsii TaxID=1857215 RepID=A0ABQ6YVT4_9ENTE|nr:MULTISPECIES: A24 family peptidase [Enterococcus]KAF1301205.1 hypothetical protein BAU17_02740 [Enterococcus sp. CU12B]MCD5003635.1 prepilin peptidase [Enterococcus saccharolyticus]
MLIFFIGTCLGSFLCVVAQRVPQKKSFMLSRSQCDHCQQVLRSWELIPLLSAVLLRFRCQRCKVRFSSISWWAELIYGGLLLFIWQQPTLSAKLITGVWLTTAFLLTLTDLFYWLVEPRLLYPLHGLLWWIMFYQNQEFHWETLAIVGVLASSLSLFYQHAIGLGDLILLLLWSPWLTLNQFALLVLVASASAIVIFCGYAILRITQIRLPFVPFLSFGLFVAYFLL